MKNLKDTTPEIFFAQTKAALMNNLMMVAYDIQEDIQSSFPQKGGGKKYVINGKIHYASSPGQPPAILSGRLKDSITVRSSISVKGITKRDIAKGGRAKASDIINKPKTKDTIDIGTRVPYSGIEKGTENVQARPYIMPIYRNKVPGHIKNAIDSV